VPKIPTPFIGGSASPRRDSEPQEVAPPFHPGVEETEPPSPEAAPQLEDEARLEESAPGVDSVAAEQESALEQPAEAHETDFPEFLAGPDGTVLEVEEEEAAVEPVLEDVTIGEEQESVPLASIEQLAEKAEELRTGEFDAWIRTLVDQLGPYAPEIAIARAFAAGFMAARDSEES